MTPRTRTILGWIPVILIALFIIPASALPKFFIPDASETATFMRDLGVWDLRIIFGILEIVCVVLWLIPRTSTIGFVLMTGLMGGALATNLTHPNVDTMPLLPASILALMTFSAYFRNPELLSRLLRRPVPEKI